MTLNSDDLHTETTVVFGPGVVEHGIVLNGEPSAVTGRMKKMFEFVKARVYERRYRGTVGVEEWEKCHFAI